MFLSSDAQVPGEGPAQPINAFPLKIEWDGFGVSGASWKAHLRKYPEAKLRDFIEGRSGKLRAKESVIKHFWRGFVPSERQSARTPFILLEPKEEPEDCSSSLGQVRYRYCSAVHRGRYNS